MNKLSTGDDSTLGNYRKLAAGFFGEDSFAVKWLDEKIAEQGADSEVTKTEAQMVNLLGYIHVVGEQETTPRHTS